MATAQVSQSVAIRPTPVALAMAASAVLLGTPAANLVSRFHLTTEAAFLACSILSSGGTYALLAIWPFMAPVIGTLNASLMFFGVSSTAAF